MTQDAVATYTSSAAPRKYGDGGSIKADGSVARTPKVKRTRLHELDNARIVMTCSHEGAGLVATCAPHDRAHQEFAPDRSMLKAAAGRDGRVQVMSSKPRLYPRVYMVNSDDGPVSFETAAESVGEIEEWLRAQLGATTIARTDTASELIRRACEHSGVSKIRGVIDRRRFDDGMTEEEAALHAAADRLLAGS